MADQPIDLLIGRHVADRALENIEHAPGKGGAEQILGLPARIHVLQCAQNGSEGVGAALQMALRREGYKNRTLLRTAADGMYVFDTNGDVIQVNDAFCRMLGYTEQEDAHHECCAVERAVAERELLAKIAALGGSNPPFETRHRRRDGTIIQVEISAAKVEIDGRQVVYNSARDITGRKQSEQAIKDSEARLHTLVETAMDAVVIMDSGGAITGWNNQAANIFGRNRDEVVGRLLHQIIIPLQFRESHVRGLKRFLESGEAPLLNSRIEISALHRDGHEFPIELSVTPIRMQNEYEFSAFIRDITKKKQFEDLIWKQANYDTLTGLPNRGLTSAGQPLRLEPHAFRQTWGPRSLKWKPENGRIRSVSAPII